MLHDVEPCVTSFLRLENDWCAPFNNWQLVEWSRIHVYFFQLRSKTLNMLKGLFQHSTMHDMSTGAARFVAQQMLNHVSPA